MKAARCQAIAASGKPCSAQVQPGRPWCLWHDPEAGERRSELSRRGGLARSNAARAKKVLPADVLDVDGVRAIVGRTMKRVLASEVEPAVGNAVANLARVALAGAEQAALADLAERVTTMEVMAAREDTA